MSMLLALTFTVTASAPPLPPEEAVRVLRASRSIADRTDARSVEIPEAPRSLTGRSSVTDGPFGPFPRYSFPPLNCCRVLNVPLHRDSRYRRMLRAPVSRVPR